MKTREIILLLLIILAGVMLTLFQTGRLHWPAMWWVEAWRGGEEFSFEETRRLVPPFPSWLVIDNPRGEVIIEKGDTEAIEINWEKKVWADKEEEAKATADEIKLAVASNSTETIINVLQPTKIRRSYESRLKINAPSSLVVKVTNAHGQVRVEGMAGANIVNAHGQVSVTSLSGDATVKNRHGNISLSDITGSAEISSAHGDIVLFRVEQPIMLEARHGHLDIEDLRAKLEVKAEHLSIQGRKIKGPIFLATSYEPVDLKEIGQAEINNRYGLVRVEKVEGSLIVNNRYATVAISEVQGNLRVSGKNLRVVGRQVRSQEIEIFSSYDNVELKDFSGKCIISLHHGDGYLEPASLASGLNFQGNHASLLLVWPPGEAWPTQISVRHGEIFWRLAANASVAEKNSETILTAFDQKKEGATVLVNSSYGKVTVEQAAGSETKKETIFL